MTDNQSPQPGYLTDEFIQDHMAYMHHIPVGMKAAKICGDDRGLTTESAMLINEVLPKDVLPVTEGYYRTFGSDVGEAMNFLKAGIATHGEVFIRTIDGIEGAIAAVKQLNQGRAFPHTGESNEHDAAQFDTHGQGGVGCAYNENAGAVVELLLDDTNQLQSIGRETVRAVFGDTDGLDELLQANTALAEHLGQQAGDGQPGSYKFSRRQYTQLIEQGQVVAVLAGSHETASKTGLIYSFDKTLVGNPIAAQHDGKAFYQEDIAGVTDSIGSLLQRYGIKPELFAKSIVLDSVPTRFALASHDVDEAISATPDPRSIAVGMIGDARTAMDELNARYV